MSDPFIFANCRKPEANPEDWHPVTTNVPHSYAERLCRHCPALADCAKTALSIKRPQGIWAGIHLPDYAQGRKSAFMYLRMVASGAQVPVRPKPRPPQGDRTNWAKGSGRPSTHPDECLQCTRRMISQKAPSKRGFVRHGAHGFCTGCYARRRREEAAS